MLLMMGVITRITSKKTDPCLKTKSCFRPAKRMKDSDKTRETIEATKTSGHAEHLLLTQERPIAS